MKLSQLKPNPANPRTITKEQMEKLKNSIEKLPKMMEIRPIIYDENFIILAGNMRFQALQGLGKKEIPDTWAKCAKDFSEEEKREFIVKDNLSMGEWNFEELANEYTAEELEDWGMEKIIFPDVVEEGETDPDDVPAVPEKPISKRGDVYQLGNHRIMCGDSTVLEDVEKLMDGKKADMVFTDPPYNQNFSGGVDKAGNKSKAGNKEKIKNDKLSDEEYHIFCKDVFSILRDFCVGGWYVSFYRKEMENILRACSESGLTWRSLIIWKKNRPALSPLDYHNNFEPILYGYNNHKWYGGKNKSDVWEISRPSVNDLHPTMKPVELCNMAIQNSSKNGDTVLDLFLGSASTLISCEQLGRRCYGMELDEKYVDVCVKRWEEFTGKKAIKL